MQTNYEIAYGRMVPAFRRAVAREMRVRYQMKQAEIARRLGITQAAVSKYLSQNDKEDGAEYRSDVSAFIDASMKGDEKAAHEAMCRACQASMKFDCAFVAKR